MIFGVVFFFVVIRFYCKKSRELYEVDFKEVKLNYKVVLIGGFIVGVVSGFFGIGGGVINVFFFIYMGFFYLLCGCDFEFCYSFYGYVWSDKVLYFG